MWIEVLASGHPKEPMQLYSKPPVRGAGQGWFAKYDPPAHDPELESCGPIFPVPAFRDWVEFTVTPKALSEQELAELLEAAKGKARQRIDAAAGRARLRYITDVPGQQGTYLLKEQQARGYIAAGTPADATPWPLIDGEAAGTGQSAAAVAAAVVAQADAWMTVNAAIEAARIGGKKQVNEATSKGQAEAVANQVEGAIDQI